MARIDRGGRALNVLMGFHGSTCREGPGLYSPYENACYGFLDDGLEQGAGDGASWRQRQGVVADANVWENSRAHGEVFAEL